MEDSQYHTIARNYERVRDEIARAARDSGRPAESVRLLVVTKAQPAGKIRAAYQAGARFFGENYPEETLTKLPELADLAGAEWHMIGHLQSRKAKIVADHFHLLQSLDSFGLAEKLNRLLGERGRVLPVLLEVNVSGEESKFGLPAWDEARWDALLSVIEQICSLGHLRIHGLMTMPPLYADPEQTRPYFQKNRRLRDYLAARFPLQSWQEISMGTSADFRVAVEEGATIVRVGTAVMGQRPPRD
jgi:hypothetical protein